MLDGIRVDYYGTPTPLNQVGNLVDPRPDADHGPALGARRCCRPSRRRIRTSDLDLNPQNDGKIIRIPIPPLTEERRKTLVKHAHKHAEEGRVAIRNVRRDVNDHLKKLLKDHEISEDDEKQAMAEVQKLTDGTIETDRRDPEEEGSGDHGGVGPWPLTHLECGRCQKHVRRRPRCWRFASAAGRSSPATTSSARPATCGPATWRCASRTMWRYREVLPLERAPTGPPVAR